MEEVDLINQEAWNNLSETFAEALRELLDQHRSKVLWNDTGDLEASRGACKTLVPSRLCISALFATVSEGRHRVVLGKRQQPQGTGRRTSGAIILCAFCGNKCHAKEMSCVVTMQYDNCVSTCVVFVAEAVSVREEPFSRRW